MQRHAYIGLFSACGVLLVISAIVSCGVPQGTSSPPPIPTLQSITVTPASAAIIAGRTQQFSVTANFSDGSRKDVTTSASWSSSDTTVANVNTAGLVTSAKQGVATIGATYQSSSSTAQFTAGPFIVQVSVVASDSSNRPLNYSWLSSDGVITGGNSPTAMWTLPDGPGLHFAYVLVSNGVGGYTERRIAVNTDTIGTPLVLAQPVTFSLPAATPQNGEFFRGFITGETITPLNHQLYLPDTPVYYVDNATNARFPGVGTVTTNIRGEFVIPGVPFPPTAQGNIFCPGAPLSGFCGNYGPLTPLPPAMAFTEYKDNFGPQISAEIVGEATLQDGSPCGTVNEFFGVEVTASATLLDATGKVLAGPVRADQWGDFAFPYSSAAASVLLKCESAPSMTIVIPALQSKGISSVGKVSFAGINPPDVTSITAQFNSTSVGKFLPPPTGFPSDIVPLADATSVAEKGLDTRVGACQYYLAVGAVTNCDASGNFTGAMTFRDWKSQVKIDEFAAKNGIVYQATYINKIDLNLARNHHSVSYGPGQTAAYVCNHLGPSVLDPEQTEIDQVVLTTFSGGSLVACVAMDYTTTPGVNNGDPYVRFLIFGPSGQLLPSVNLDGRREKFVPGTCIVCHGGDHYAGKFPEDGSGSANVGGHFLPYDTGNFEFSSQSGLTEADQETAIYNLNQNVLNAGPTQAEQDLIAGWYSKNKTLDKNYIPSSWQGQNSTTVSFYQNVNARSCRTCHVALADGYSFENYQNFGNGKFLYGSGTVDNEFADTVCGGTFQLARAHKMPNSLVTFNRFWLSSGSSIDQPSITGQFIRMNGNTSKNCAPGATP